ncbi:DUF3885 domain-containing protein [Cohnella hashimotonis]|uniref:DUF3885 domain-containing protein n=1 Tax=Cohnella hashimotonis TaxID=2826895 RepID=A0ABT6TPB7_9BACL|nr:DUF3885 domain-containing protein [Cohnella hashimotonis]MDI4648068.1 DUF3885 domain-containing protein [Cohnella hashimotonis]
MEEKFSSKLKLESSLFYNAEYGIRFEVGNPDPSVSDEAYRAQVHHRAKTLFTDVHHADDDILMVVNHDSHRATKRTKLKAFDHAFYNSKVIRTLACVNLHKYDDDDDEWESYRYVLGCKRSELNYRKVLFAPNDIYFVNLSKNTIFHFYDSRGLDVAASSKEALRELYVKRNDWILRYDRKRIDSMFMEED